MAQAPLLQQQRHRATHLGSSTRAKQHLRHYRPTRGQDLRGAAVSAAAPLQTAWPPVVLQTTSDEGQYPPPQPELGWPTDFSEHWHKGKLLGAGSFGTVHLGVHAQTGMEAAVKTLPKVRGKLTREKTLEKIWRETDMLTRLQRCKGVVRLLGCYEDPISVQLVMELGGGDLQQFVEANGTLDEPSLAWVAFEVLKIIKSCHDLGVLHGDIKPANFVVGEVKKSGFLGNGKPTPCNLRAIDLGCSQFLGPRRLSKRTGTPIFMAPEIFRRNYSDPVDTWAMGVMLYWLFCKKFPFFEDSEVIKQAKLDAVEAAVTTVPIAYNFGAWLQMSPEGLNFIQSCLLRDENARATCDELLQHPWLKRHVGEAELRQALDAVCTAA